MSIATLLVLLLILYVVSTVVTDPGARRLLQVVAVVCLCFWLLDFVGLVDFDALRLRRHH